MNKIVELAYKTRKQCISVDEFIELLKHYPNKNKYAIGPISMMPISPYGFIGIDLWELTESIITKYKK